LSIGTTANVWMPATSTAVIVNGWPSRYVKWSPPTLTEISFEELPLGLRTMALSLGSFDGGKQ